jgi:hypothetical protein
VQLRANDEVRKHDGPVSPEPMPFNRAGYVLRRRTCGNQHKSIARVKRCSGASKLDDCLTKRAKISNSYEPRRADRYRHVGFVIRDW